jgi:MFS superfamily sulfate permease-like transporter
MGAVAASHVRARRVRKRREVLTIRLIPGWLGPSMHGNRLAVHSGHSLFLRRPFFWSKPVPLPAMATLDWRPADQPFSRILHLQPACPVSADNADALQAAIIAQVQAAVPRPWAVVLDLSATPALHDCAAAALQQLGSLLRDGHVSLRVVLPAAQARAALATASAGGAMDAKTVHPSARTAMLAAYASLPGAALVTPALNHLLAQPPEVLPLPARSPPQ